MGRSRGSDTTRRNRRTLAAGDRVPAHRSVIEPNEQPAKRDDTYHGKNECNCWLDSRDTPIDLKLTK